MTLLPVSSSPESMRSTHRQRRSGQKQFDQMYKYVPVGVAQFDLHGFIHLVNPRFCDMLGYTRAELQGLHFSDLTFSGESVSPDEARQRDQWRHEVISGQREQFEFMKRFRRADGSELWVKETLTLAYTRPPRLLVIAEMLTPPKEIATKLIHSGNTAQPLSQVFATILSEITNNLEDAITLVDPTGSACFSSQGVSKLFGIQPQDRFLTLPVPARNAVVWARSPAGRPLSFAELPSSRAMRGEVLKGENAPDVLMRRLDGQDILVNTSAVPVRNERGDIVGAVMVFRNVTKPPPVEIAEREALMHEREAAQARELALIETNRRLDTFLGLASHEIRTPLTTIMGTLQIIGSRLKVLKDGKVSSLEMQAMLDKLLVMADQGDVQAQRLNRFVQDLLDASALQFDRFTLNPVYCHVGLLIMDVVGTVRHRYPNHQIESDMVVANTLWIVADPQRISQVIEQYLMNAAKFSPEGSAIRIAVEAHGGCVHIAVTDQGQGLPQDEQQRIWDRFYRVPSITNLRGSSIGLGLGLYISRAIIELHGGTVGVQSALGQGSTFWFELPLVQERAAEQDLPIYTSGATE